jgi:hypothetical protein
MTLTTFIKANELKPVYHWCICGDCITNIDGLAKGGCLAFASEFDLSPVADAIRRQGFRMTYVMTNNDGVAWYEVEKVDSPCRCELGHKGK